MKRMSDDLLAELAEHLRCYISDLPHARARESALFYMEQISPDAYPLSVWNDALSYLFDERVCLQTPEQVQAYLEQKRSETSSIAQP